MLKNTQSAEIPHYKNVAIHKALSLNQNNTVTFHTYNFTADGHRHDAMPCIGYRKHCIDA